MSGKTTFADRAISYFLNLTEPAGLNGGIGFLNPYSDQTVKSIVTNFYKRFFDDNHKRIYLLGINPGRFGGGVTGISFTDPIALEEHCGIKNNFDKKAELSSKYIYSFINAYGSVDKFHSKFFISALFPLAIIKNGKNYNYYDDKITYKSLKPLITAAIKHQIELGAYSKTAICLGRKNYAFFSELNEEHNFFENISVLDHPRFIMQYRKKSMDKYIDEYISVLKSAEKYLE